MKARSQETALAPTTLESLGELNRLKTVLLNTAAHELSTPLTPIQLQLSLLRSDRLGPLTPRQRESLEVLERNIERLSQLIRDLLDVAQIEANRLPARRQNMDLAQAATEAVEAVHPIARQANLRLILETGKEAPILADPKRIAQVFQALLTNAIKFTPSGGTVRVRTIVQGNVALAEVEDTGVGIKPEDFQNLFQPFGQSFDTMAITRSGAGLGLAISQGVVEHHGGRIWCDSQGPGKGSTFTFAMPLAGADPAAVQDVLARMAHKVPRETIKRRGGLFFFKCPTCRSRDIHLRFIKNKYECNRCGHQWR